MKRIMILQPGYLPWLGFFDMLSRSDILVFHSDLQYDKGSWRNRNRIRTREGWNWLTVPVLLRSHSSDRIDAIRIDNSKDWCRRHLNLLRENYLSSMYFDRYFGRIEGILSRDWEFLIDLDLELIFCIIEELGLEREHVFSSDLDLEGLRSTMRLIKICEELGGDIYLSGTRGRNYIQEDLFKFHGIELEFHDYDHPIYKQNFEGFESYMSIIDLLFNHGEDSLKILSSGSVKDSTVNLQRSFTNKQV